MIVYAIYGQNSPIANNIGVQAATSVLLFVLLLVFSVVQFRFLDRRVHYADA